MWLIRIFVIYHFYEGFCILRTSSCKYFIFKFSKNGFLYSYNFCLHHWFFTQLRGSLLSLHPPTYPVRLCRKVSREFNSDRLKLWAPQRKQLWSFQGPPPNIYRYLSYFNHIHYTVYCYCVINDLVSGNKCYFTCTNFFQVIDWSVRQVRWVTMRRVPWVSPPPPPSTPTWRGPWATPVSTGSTPTTFPSCGGQGAPTTTWTPMGTTRPSHSRPYPPTSGCKSSETFLNQV